MYVLTHLTYFNLPFCSARACNCGCSHWTWGQNPWMVLKTVWCLFCSTVQFPHRSTVSVKTTILATTCKILLQQYLNKLTTLYIRSRGSHVGSQSAETAKQPTKSSKFDRILKLIGGNPFGVCPFLLELIPFLSSTAFSYCSSKTESYIVGVRV